MLKRNLINGGEVEELKEPINLLVRTLVPPKWILVDQETGQVYQGSDRMDSYGPWVRLNVDDRYVPQDIADRVKTIIESASAVETRMV
ncbi:MAG: hypothetical protein RLY61_518 [Candidatus Parcubacteria bacterium]